MDAMLLPGDIEVTRGLGVLRTILGSCVSLCLYDPSTGIGGMNHYALPKGRPGEDPNRYGGPALLALYEAMIHHGAHPDTMVAAVFGGAHILSVGSAGDFVEENIHAALRFVHEHGIHLTDTHLGGHAGRKVKFDVGRNKITVELIAGSQSEENSRHQGIPEPFSYTGRMSVR